MKEYHIISVEEMRAADARTIENGTPGRELMYRAARGVFDVYEERRVVGWYERRTVIVCGSGNNGGDGYALAMILKEEGHKVALVLLSDKFSEDGAYYYNKCLELEVPIISFNESEDEIKDESKLEALLFSSDIIVDCILGTGFSGEPRGNAAKAIELIERVRKKSDPMERPYVVSVDINSGMNGNTGESVLAVTSDLTVSIGYYKTGFFTGKTEGLVGDLVNVDIGISLESEL